jgi:aquaporin Z
MSSLKNPRDFSASQALRLHWPEYLIEAWALGLFMIAASGVTTVLEYPGAPLYKIIDSQAVRLALIGIAMGLTAVLVMYSAWGKRSGAHMNPAVTLAFLSLGRISPINAVFYMLAQILGGLGGVLIAWGLLGKPFAEPPVLYIVTQPGPLGIGAAFAAEFAISYFLMLTILIISNQRRWARYTGIVAGFLIAIYVALESPLSGMSMNPARSLASAIPGLQWGNLWIYFSAPVAGMWLAARTFHLLTPVQSRSHHTAKIVPTGETL